MISRRAIREFCEDHPRAETALDVWYRNALEADWSSIVDVRAMYPHADAVGKCTIFNIHGNDYRLIASIKYHYRTVYIRAILTHKVYDEGRWKDACV